MTDPGRPPGLESALPGLSPSASTKERIAALLEIGIPPAELRQAIGVSDTTLRNWNEDATVPRNSALRALDDLRTAVVALHEAGLTGERAVNWLTSRNLGRWLRGARPIDVLRTEPLRALAAIEDLLTPSGDEALAPVVHLQIRTESDRDRVDRSPSRRKPRRRRPATAH